MFATPSISELALFVGWFAMGLLTGTFFAYWSRRKARIRAESGPLTVKVKGLNEPIVIPEHYNSAAVDKLLRQLEIA